MDELQNLVNKLQTSYFLTEAILKHYCESISKLTGESPEKIKSDIDTEIQRLFKIDKDERVQKQIQP